MYRIDDEEEEEEDKVEYTSGGELMMLSRSRINPLVLTAAETIMTILVKSFKQKHI